MEKEMKQVRNFCHLMLMLFRIFFFISIICKFLTLRDGTLLSLLDYLQRWKVIDVLTGVYTRAIIFAFSRRICKKFSVFFFKILSVLTYSSTNNYQILFHCKLNIASSQYLSHFIKPNELGRKITLIHTETKFHWDKLSEICFNSIQPSLY